MGMKETEAWGRRALVDEGPLALEEFLDRPGGGDPVARGRGGRAGVREADYRSIGVVEMWFLDPERQDVRALHRDEAGSYRTLPAQGGRLTSRVLAGFSPPVEALWRRPLPSVLETLRELGAL